jgi:chitin synthase
LIYSFCNIDDVSWGTKGSTDNEGGHGTSGKSPKQTKIEFVEKWLISNILLVFIMIIVSKFLPDGKINKFIFYR